ncbi:LPS-assembly protein LptD [Sphingosinicella terrae]|uniref:LPS-assembly protein LptD n=1 Tax=Sphingosinicella terrae TaxID=2172047 RepID=UPI002547E278|nr:LPS assembly protein LptD [Sphingosinicella terrae]
MTTLRLICRTALPLLLAIPFAAAAQEPAAPVSETPDQIAFSADQLAYDQNADIVTASGAVRMNREGYHLSADSVSWNRVNGEVRAEGDVRIISPAGDVAYGDSVLLEDNLRDGMVQNLLLVLEDGGRLAAVQARRENGYTTLERAAYSPCTVLGPDGCPKEPTWQINAVRVVHDPVRHRISYEGASLNLFGTPIIALPGLSHPDGSQGGGSGLLVPDIRFSRRNGFEVSVPYYLRFSPNRDATLTPHVYSDVLPMLEGEYRELNSLGAFQLRGYVTHGSRLPIDDPSPDRDEGVRAYVEGNGRFQLSPTWTLTAAGRYVTDRTFLRRYDISRDDRLRSFVEAERITANSYISVAGWAFQGLRITDVAGQQPIAIPAIDARWRLDDPLAGGQIEIQANSLSILRPEGQDSQRAFASARWERRGITSLGQELVLTAFARGDVYHANDTELTQTVIYRGEEGWNGRFIGAIAADLRWPLVGEFLGGTQRLTPRLQFVASPPTENLDIPNEDARSVDLEDSNLFALNRFPGYDRWEDGVRMTYGADWAVDLRGLSVRTNIGQSYRLSTRETILPPGTGLSDRFSDFVGRTTVRIGRRVSFVHRFRLDKDNFAIRRNEIDATVGGRQTYATVGYLRLDRDINTSIEDLRDREEVRVAGRVRFAGYWSVFGSAVVDLTSRREDIFSSADGFEPVRHRLGILYDDDCIELGVTWRRDYETTGDARRGNTFLFRVALRNLGR